jgi:hypothetical protein
MMAKRAAVGEGEGEALAEGALTAGLTDRIRTAFEAKVHEDHVDGHAVG